MGSALDSAARPRQARAVRNDRSARRWVPALLFVAVAGLHLTLAWVSGPTWEWHGQSTEYYAYLTDAFLAGQTSLLVKPSAELLALPDPRDPAANRPYRLHDASLYRGKYYLYFGPTPALVLFLPYRVLSGRHLPGRLGVGLFCAGGFACSCGLLWLLVKREKWDCPLWLLSAAVLSLGTVPGVFFLVIRPSFYEVAIASGYCCMMAGFLLAAHGLREEGHRIGPLTGAGLCFGLAAGCRPTFALVAALMVALVGWRTRTNRPATLGFTAPLLTCGALLGSYNYVRFGSVLEFGNRYQLAAGLHNRGTLFSLAKVVPSIYYLLFGSPLWSTRFPYAGPSDRLSAFSALPEGLSLGPTIGLLWLAPLAFVGLILPMVWRDRRIREHATLVCTRLSVGALYATAAATLGVFASLGWVVGRYLADFAPELLLLSWLVILMAWQGIRRGPKARALVFQCLVGVVVCYSLTMHFLLCMQR